MKRVLLFTGQDIGFELVKRLHERRDLSLFVVIAWTLRDDLNGYRSPVGFCQEHGIPFLITAKIDGQALKQISDFEPALILSAYYAHRIPNEVIGVAPLGTVNLHPGLLPHYRGKFPTPWYILNGEREFGMALHQIVDEGIDTGPVLVQARYPLSSTITGHELLRATMRVGVELIVTYLGQLLAGSLPARPQTEGGSYYDSIEKRWQINWNLSTTAIERRVRVHAKPYLPAYTFLMNRAVYINRARVVDVPGFRAQGGGHIMQFDDAGFVVSCADGCLRVDQYDVYPPVLESQLPRLFEVGQRFEAL